MTETLNFTIYKTPNIQSVLTAILSAQQEITHMLIQHQLVPWNLSTTQKTTFILHKSNIQNTNWKSNHTTTKTTNQPHFYAFDHGDHTHIVFPTKHHNNTNRTVNRILKFFEGTSAGSAEAYTMLQLIRQIKNFIIYLIRYGLRRFTKFGTKINHLASYFEALDETDGTEEIDLTPCVAYIEQKKRFKKYIQ
jgi:hypothetical protein